MEEAHVAFVLTLFIGRARELGVSMWESDSPWCFSFNRFCTEMTMLFDRSVSGDDAAQLSWLTQEQDSITNYCISFQALAAACGLNEAALRAHFLEGLSNSIVDETALLDLPQDHKELAALCLRVENWLSRHRQPLSLSWQVRAIARDHIWDTTGATRPCPVHQTPSQYNLNVHI